MNFTGYRRDIDGLRAVAVVPVVLGHAGLGLFAGGFVGVDVFFVISGFLITGILVRELAEGRFSLIDFYERRARRILPALFVVLLACIVVFWFLLSPLRYQDLGKSSVATLLFASNIFFWRRGSDYFSADVETQPLLHTWSLAVEEQFYIVFPVLLWLIAFWSANRRTLLIAGLSVVSFALAVWVVRTQPMTAFYLTPTRAWELGLGALLALGAFPVLRHRMLAELVAAAGLLAIAYSVFMLDKTVPFPGFNALPPCLGAVAIIWAGQSHITLTGRLLSGRIIVGIGLMSYSLYLVHWPVLVAARVWTGTPDLQAVTLWTCIALSCGLGWASWRFVERPFRIQRHGAGFGRRAIFAWSGLGGAALLGMAGVLVVTKGLPSRVPEAFLKEYAEAIMWGGHPPRCGVNDIGTTECNVLGSQIGGKISTIMIGDSHTQHATPGLEDWLTDHGLRGIAFHSSGCPPLLGVRREKGSNPIACQEGMQDIVDWIASQGHVDTIILLSRWALAAEAIFPEGEAGLPYVLIPVALDAPKTSQNTELLQFGLDQMLAAIAPYTDRIVIIGSIPEIGFDVPEQAIRSVVMRQALPKTPTLLDYNQRNARAQTILTELAQKYGAIFVDPGPVFCTPDCQVQRDEKLLYRDDDHLSTFGARMMIPMLLDLALSPDL